MPETTSTNINPMRPLCMCMATFPLSLCCFLCDLSVLSEAVRAYLLCCHWLVGTEAGDNVWPGHRVAMDRSRRECMTWSQVATSELGSDGTEAFGALSVASDSRQDLPCDCDALL